MKRSVNIYTEELKFKNEVETLVIETKLNDRFSLDLTKKDEKYIISNIDCTKKSVKNLLRKRYEGTSHDAENINTRLRDAYYFVRKLFRDSDSAYSSDNMEVKIGTPQPAESEIPQLEAQEEKQDEPKTKKVKTQEVPKFGLERQIFELVLSGVDSDEAKKRIADITKNQLDEWGVKPGRKEVVIKIDEAEIVEAGVVHKDFETILRTLKARVNLALVGPAGSGKTTVVSKAADILKLPFYAKSVSSHTSAIEFFGYQDANGNYVKTDFRRAFEEGGVFLLDEFDNGNPNVLAATNQATANETCAFPDKLVKKHPDFICVMAGNTFGHGATREYVGRNKIDAATLDRFVFFEFLYDEELERQLSPDSEWCDLVQRVRAEVAKKKIRAVVSPRATFDGAILLAAGIPKREVIKMAIYKGMSQDEINLIKGVVEA